MASPSTEDADTKRWASVREQVSDLASYCDDDDEEAERKEKEVRRSQNILLALDAVCLMEKAKIRPPDFVLTTYTGSVDLHWNRGPRGTNCDVGIDPVGGVTCDFEIDPEVPDSEVTIYKRIEGLDPRCMYLPYSIGNKEHQTELLRVLSLCLDELYPSSQ